MRGLKEVTEKSVKYLEEEMERRAQPLTISTRAAEGVEAPAGAARRSEVEERESQEYIASLLQGTQYNMSSFACHDLLRHWTTLKEDRKIRIIEYPRVKVVRPEEAAEEREVNLPKLVEKMRLRISREFRKEFGFKPFGLKRAVVRGLGGLPPPRSPGRLHRGTTDPGERADRRKEVSRQS